MPFSAAPAVSSTALVVVSGFPPPLTNQANTVGDAGAETSLATQIVIASSDPVLAGALPKLSPPANSTAGVGQQDLRRRRGRERVLSITATGKTADQAENTANAVANSYIAYVTGASNNACARRPRWSAGDNRDRIQGARAHRHIRHPGRIRRGPRRFRHLLAVGWQ